MRLIILSAIMIFLATRGQKAQKIAKIGSVIIVIIYVLIIPGLLTWGLSLMPIKGITYPKYCAAIIYYIFTAVGSSQLPWIVWRIIKKHPQYDTSKYSIYNKK